MLEEEKKEELLALLTGKKYRELKSQLVEMNEVDIASFIEELDSELAADILENMEAQVRRFL